MKKRMSAMGALLAVMMMQFAGIAPVLAQEPGGSNTAGQENQQEQLTERPEYRTEYSKTFQNQDDEYVTKTYPERIHVQKGGQFISIDNTIIAQQSEYEWRNAMNKYKAEFQDKTMGQSLLKLTGDDLDVEEYFQGQQQTTAITKGLQIEYPNILPNITVQYQLMNELVKGNIILHNSQAVDQEIVNIMNVGDGIILVQEDDQTIRAERNSKKLWHITAPSMEDANKKRSSNVKITLEQQEKNSYKIRIEADKEWLKGATFPVVIDPDIITTATVTSYTESASPNTSTWPQRLMSVGQNMVDGYYKGQTRSYAKFATPNLPQGVSAQDITRAEAVLYQYVQYQPYSVQARRITSTWDPATLDHNTQPSFESSGVTRSIDGTKHYLWNITGMVKDWTINPSTNNGVAFVSIAEHQAGGLFKSQYYPGAPEDQKPHIDIWHNPPNRLPNIPELGAPNHGAVLGGDSSSKGKTVEFWVNPSDVNNNIEKTVMTFKNLDGTEYKKEVAGTGWKNTTIHLHDGHWSWTAQSKDAYGWGEISAPKQLLIDTTPPSNSTLTQEPEFTQGLQNQIHATQSVDALGGVIQYHYQRTEQSNGANKEEQWTNQQAAGFANLEHGKTYCYTVTAKDERGNTSQQSRSTCSTQDAQAPKVETPEISPKRISPKQKDGNNDQAQISGAIEEEHFQSATMTIRNAETKTIAATFQIPKQYNSIFNDATVQDGAYQVIIEAQDKAGNKTVNNEGIIIVDNTPSMLDIITPLQGQWTNASIIRTSGQVEPDSQLTITTPKQSLTATLTEEGIYNEELSLEKEQQTEIQWKNTDNTGNTIQEKRTVYHEAKAPSLYSSINGLTTKDTTPTIQIELEDNGTETFISGIHKDTLAMTLTTPEEKEIGLVTNGINMQKDWGTLQTTCAQDDHLGISGTVKCSATYQFIKAVQPDGEYKLEIATQDYAGNSTTETIAWTIDSTTELEITEGPAQGNKYNYATHKLEGVAEQGATLEIKGNSDQETIFIDPVAEQPERVIISECNRQATQTVCKWTIDTFQLEKDQEQDRNVNNTVTYTATDRAGNTKQVVQNSIINVHQVSASMSTDKTHFSPNGDGKQDGIQFTDIETTGILKSYKIVMRTKEGEIVQELEGSAGAKEQYWDGKNQEQQFVQDGEYTYQLYITTTDNIIAETALQNISARTEVEGEIVITTPKDQFITTSSAVEVAGQAPEGTKVTICIDTLGLQSDCDFIYTTTTEEQNWFSRTIPLPRLPDQETSTHRIAAWAQDEYGNKTKQSNNVTVIVDSTESITAFSVAPYIVGINTKEDIQAVQNKEKEQNEIHTALVKAQVTKNTETVKIYFKENIEEEWKIIKETQERCQQQYCTIEHEMIIPPVEGGLYTIVIETKKGEAIEKMETPLMIDANIPNKPIIVDINGINEKNERNNTRTYNGAEYTNKDIVEIRGVAVPKSALAVKTATGQEWCKTTTNSIGLFTCQVPLVAHYPEYKQATTEAEILAEVSTAQHATLSEKVKLVIDQQNPEITAIAANKEWFQSGKQAEMTISANEALWNGYVQTPLEFQHQLELQYTAKTGTTFVQIPGSTKEGLYAAKGVIEDIAGNKTEQEKTINIDNTAPEKAILIQEDNADKTGINNKNKEVVKSRTEDIWLTRADEITIKGTAEQFSSTTLLLNEQSQAEQKQTIEECKKERTATIVNGVTIKEENNCAVSLKGELKEEKGYRAAITSQDRAGNKAEYSEQILIYKDVTAPEKPATNIPKGTYEKTLDVIITAEQYADVKITQTGKKQKEEIVNVGEKGATTFTIEMPEIGEYAIQIEAYDVVGNKSEIATHTIKRSEIPKPIKIIRRVIRGLGGGLVKGAVSRYRDDRLIQEWAQQERLLQMTFKISADGRQELESANIRAPKIQDAYRENGIVTVTGAATPKRSKADVTVKYEIETRGFGFCWKFWSCQETKEKIEKQQIAVNNVKVSIQQNGKQVQDYWMNDLSGSMSAYRWRADFSENNIDVSQPVVAQTKIYDDFDIDLPEKGTVNIDYRYNGRGISSGRSKGVVAGIAQEELVRALESKIGIAFQDGVRPWDRGELELINEALGMLPASFFQGTTLQIISTQSGAGCRIGTLAFVREGGREMQICNRLEDSEYYSPEKREHYKSVFIHELIHVYQATEGKAMIRLPKKETVTYRFYDLLFDEVNTGIQLHDATGRYWVEGAEIKNATSGQFVSDYARKSAKEPLSKNVPDSRAPEEVMAEMVKMYYTDPEYLKSHQTFTNENNEQQFIPIYDFIKNNIDIR